MECVDEGKLQAIGYGISGEIFNIILGFIW